jgi:hypothetical protein
LCNITDDDDDDDDDLLRDSGFCKHDLHNAMVMVFASGKKDVTRQTTN